MFYHHCECGWLHLAKTQENTCEACDKPVEASEWKKLPAEDVAGMVCTAADLRSKGVAEHAKKHGLFLYQISTNRHVLLKQDSVWSINYKDGEARSYTGFETVCGPADRQTVMKYLYDNTMNLPKHLIQKDKK